MREGHGSYHLNLWKHSATTETLLTGDFGSVGFRFLTSPHLGSRRQDSYRTLWAFPASGPGAKWTVHGGESPGGWREIRHVVSTVRISMCNHICMLNNTRYIGRIVCFGTTNFQLSAAVIVRRGSANSEDLWGYLTVTNVSYSICSHGAFFQLRSFTSRCILGAARNFEARTGFEAKQAKGKIDLYMESIRKMQEHLYADLIHDSHFSSVRVL